VELELLYPSLVPVNTILNNITRTDFTSKQFLYYVGTHSKFQDAIAHSVLPNDADKYIDYIPLVTDEQVRTQY
jgi:hypothetical protein